MECPSSAWTVESPTLFILKLWFRWLPLITYKWWRNIIVKDLKVQELNRNKVSRSYFHSNLEFCHDKHRESVPCGHRKSCSNCIFLLLPPFTYAPYASWTRLASCLIREYLSLLWRHPLTTYDYLVTGANRLPCKHLKMPFLSRLRQQSARLSSHFSGRPSVCPSSTKNFDICSYLMNRLCKCFKLET